MNYNETLPPPPDGGEAKFFNTGPCEPGGTVVDSGTNFNGYLCCSGCRQPIVWNVINGWVHLP